MRVYIKRASIGLAALILMLVGAVTVRAVGTPTLDNYPISTQQYVSQLIVGPGGGMWFSAAGPILGRITTSDTVPARYGVPQGANAPAAAVAGPDGALWFTNQWFSNTEGKEFYSIDRMTTSGTVTQFLAPSTDNGLTGLTVANGAFWTADPGSGVYEVTTSGNYTLYPISTNGGNITALTTGPDGNLWITIANGDGSGTVDEMTTSGTVTTVATISSSSFGPGTIITGPDANLWFIDDGNNAIDKMTTSGVVTSYSIPTGLSVGNFGNMAVANGEVWFVNGSLDSISNVSTTGSFGSYSLPSDDTPGFIATGSGGALWFTNNGVGGVGRITF